MLRNNALAFAPSPVPRGHGRRRRGRRARRQRRRTHRVPRAQRGRDRRPGPTHRAAIPVAHHRRGSPDAHRSTDTCPATAPCRSQTRGGRGAARAARPLPGCRALVPGRGPRGECRRQGCPGGSRCGGRNRAEHLLLQPRRPARRVPRRHRPAAVHAQDARLDGRRAPVHADVRRRPLVLPVPRCPDDRPLPAQQRRPRPAGRAAVRRPALDGLLPAQRRLRDVPGRQVPHHLAQDDSCRRASRARP